MATEKIIVQIYEIQDPFEAEKLLEIGVDQIGSVIVSEAEWKVPGVKETIRLVRSAAAKSSLIPLFNSLESVLYTLDYYQPDIVHFCESLVDEKDIRDYCRRLIQLQKEVKLRFPQIAIMRSIPIAQPGRNTWNATLELSRWFEPVSDFFLTDTLLANEPGIDDTPQPVPGFVMHVGQGYDRHPVVDGVHYAVFFHKTDLMLPPQKFDQTLRNVIVRREIAALHNNNGPIRIDSKRGTERFKQVDAG